MATLWSQSGDMVIRWSKPMSLDPPELGEPIGDVVEWDWPNLRVRAVLFNGTPVEFCIVCGKSGPCRCGPKLSDAEPTMCPTCGTVYTGEHRCEG